MSQCCSMLAAVHAAFDVGAIDPALLTEDELRVELSAAERLTSKVRAWQARLVDEANRRDLAQRDGCSSAAAWLTSQLGISAAEAARRQDEAAAVASSPDVAGAFERGEITPEHARLIASTTRAEPNLPIADLLADARQLDAGRFALRARRLRRAHQADGGLTQHEAQRQARRASVWIRPDDGMVILSAELDPVGGARVRAALFDEADRLWRAEHPRQGAHEVPVDARTNPQRLADALVNIFARPAGSGLAPEHAEVLVTITLEDLQCDTTGTAEILGVGPVPAATARRIACEAGVIPVVLGGSSETLDLGRSRRLASRAQRRALRRQHDGCAAQGCTVPFHWCQIHHVKPWEAGGGTNLADLLPLCTTHHHLVHEGGWRIRRRPDGSASLDPPVVEE